MRNIKNYRLNRAHDFIDNCKDNGIEFEIVGIELAAVITAAACARISMRRFSSDLEWLKEEIHEITEIRAQVKPIRLVALNGRAV